MDDCRNRDFPSTPPLLSGTSTTYRYNKQLYHTGAFADCTIFTATNRCFQAHRNILGPRCEFFRCCFDGRFEEAATKIISMRDDDPIAIEGMLYYLYTLDYPDQLYRKLLVKTNGPIENACGVADGDSGIEDEDDLAPVSSPNLDWNVHVYWSFDLLMIAVADKYDLAELRDMASQTLLDKVAVTRKEEYDKFQREATGYITFIENLYARDTVSTHFKELRTRILRSTCELISARVRDRRISSLMANNHEFAIELVESLGQKRVETDSAQRQENKRQNTSKERVSHIPMNEESDSEE